MVIEEHARLEILLPNEENWRHISENDIIQNSLSIAEKCMEDSSFSLGSVNSAQLSAKFRLQGTNSFNITGSKINVFSWFGDEETAINDKTVRFRGVFWVTSATKFNDIYTISASDAMIWLDSINYNDGGNDSNPIYSQLCSSRRTLNECFKTVIEQTNIALNNITKLNYIYNDDIVNNNHYSTGYCLLPPDIVGEISTKNPRDYVSWIAELACGFAYTCYKQDGLHEPYTQGGDHNPYIKIGQFSEENSVEVGYNEIELNSLEIADFVLNFSRVYCKFYDGFNYSRYNSNGGITLDISENPFEDGWYQYLDHGSHSEDCGCYQAVANVMYGKILEISHYFRPFKLKYHGKKYFRLGQKIKLPDGRFSVITSIKWQFRNGTNLACAGKDSRLLSVAAKRSQAVKVKDLTYTKINTEKSKILKQLENNKSDLQQQIDNKSNDISELSSKIQEIWGVINEMDNNER